MDEEWHGFASIRPNLPLEGLLRHVANSAAAGETLVWRRLMGQPTEDLWAAGIEGSGSSWPFQALSL